MAQSTISKKPMCEDAREVLSHIDPSRPVQIYRNLHKKCLSVRQNGIVKCHTQSIILKFCQFRVSEKGRQKVLATKRKNVHAWVLGWLYLNPNSENKDSGTPVTYNPYKSDKFHTSAGKVIAAFSCDIDATAPTSHTILAQGLTYEGYHF
jgi:hypothetical protein